MSAVADKPQVRRRDNLLRATRPGLSQELRASSIGGMPTLTGHFAVFNEWTEINSMWEGNFLERIAPGAFKKTFRENRDGMRVLFQHGGDPQIGDKPLGGIDDLREDDIGAFYESELLDTTYNRDLVPALELGLYGASFRFRVMREDNVDEPGASAHNPKGMAERTIKEAQVMEFGPVTFPAYASATAGLRCVSLSDEWRWHHQLVDAAPLLAETDEAREMRQRAHIFVTRAIVEDEGDVEPDILDGEVVEEDDPAADAEPVVEPDAPPHVDADPTGDHLEAGRRDPKMPAKDYLGVRPNHEPWRLHGENDCGVQGASDRNTVAAL